MNTGVISTRYANALLKYTQETGGGERVCAQVRQMLANPGEKPARLEPELERFVELLSRRGRMEYARLVFRTFVAMYYKSAGIKLAHLTTAIPAPQLVDKVREMLEEHTGAKVILESSVDESLVGGFTIEIDEYMLDASIRHRIDKLRRQFVIQNNRLV